MITAFRTTGTDEKGQFEFKGLSTDQKPTGTYNDTIIENSSSFFEMDTQTVKFYNETTESWI